jgi:hypothetical protein
MQTNCNKKVKIYYNDTIYFDSNNHIIFDIFRIYKNQISILEFAASVSFIRSMAILL